MHFSTLLTLIPLLTLTHSAPAPTKTTTAVAAATTTSAPCDAKTFNRPWILSNIAIRTDPSTNDGTINFHFCDRNAGLQLETSCSGNVTDGSSIGSNGGYVLCADETIAFQYEDGTIMMERGYEDDCLGEAPYNYGIAFGQADTQLKTRTTSSGLQVATQKRLLVDITSLS